jgi:microcystin-dependent protein
VQGHGQDPFTSFNLEDISSLLADMVGMIMWCPYSFENPSDLGRWLICDGTEYDISIRPELTNLLNKLGNKYGGDGVTTFKVPSLIGRYIKGGSVDDENFGKEVAGSVMKHTHSLSNSETAFESSHTHGPGNLDVKSNQSFFDIQVTASHIGGAFTYGESVSGKNAAPGGENDRRVYLKLQGNWNQNTKTGSGSSHKHALVGNVAENDGSNSNEVDHIVMVPVIRY